MIIKICEFCGKKIKAKIKSKRFCDDFCQRKHYYRRPEINRKMKAYSKLYNQRSEVKAKNREIYRRYNQKPEVKERRRILAVTKYRERRRKYQKEYGKRSEVRMKIREKEKLRRRIDQKYAIVDRLRRSLNHALNKYSKTGKIMSSKKYGINWEEIIKSLKPFPKNLKYFEIDHIIPLHIFDLTDPKEIKVAFHPSNLQWLTREENRKKSGKVLIHNSILNNNLLKIRGIK